MLFMQAPPPILLLIEAELKLILVSRFYLEMLFMEAPPPILLLIEAELKLNLLNWYFPPYY
jgi:hypothetical protein